MATEDGFEETKWRDDYRNDPLWARAALALGFFMVGVHIWDNTEPSKPSEIQIPSDEDLGANHG